MPTPSCLTPHSIMTLENRIQELAEELALEKQRVSRLEHEVEFLKSDVSWAHQERELIKLGEKQNFKQVQKMRVFYGFIIGVIAFNLASTVSPAFLSMGGIIEGEEMVKQFKLISALLLSMAVSIYPQSRFSQKAIALLGQGVSDVTRKIVSAAEMGEDEQ